MKEPIEMRSTFSCDERRQPLRTLAVERMH